MSTTLFHIRKNTERKLFHIWIAVYTQYLLIRNSLSKICEIFKNTHPGLRNNKRWLGADLSFWQPLWNGEFLTYFGVVVVSKHSSQCLVIIVSGVSYIFSNFIGSEFLKFSNLIFLRKRWEKGFQILVRTSFK